MAAESSSKRTTNELITIASTIWSIGWKSLPLWSFLAGFLFWRYLGFIGRPDLFLQSISNAAGLVTFLVGFVFLCALVAVSLAMPSLYFAVVSSTIGKDLSQEAERSLHRSLRWVVAGVLLATALVARRWSYTTAIFVGLPIGILLRFALDYHRERDMQSIALFFGPPELSRAARFGRFLLYIGTMWIGGFLCIFPALLTLSIATFNGDQWWITPLFVICVTAGAALTLVPAHIYFHGLHNGKSWQLRVGTFVAAVAVLTYLFFFFVAPAAGEKLMGAAAEEIGIRTSAPYTYLIRSENLAKERFDTERWDTRAEATAFTVKATVPLLLGDVILLCPKDLATSEKLKEKSAQECIALKHSEVMRIPELKPKDF